MKDYKAYVGPRDRWDRQAAGQFTFMIELGLRERHRLLDVGCGSLRAGRLFIPYLEPEHYFGIEPNHELVQSGLENEVGDELKQMRRPSFLYSDSFLAEAFGVSFDFALAQSIFTHATPVQIRLCFRRVFAALRLGGQFAATYALGKQDFTVTKWEYPKSHFYPQKFIRDAGEVAGFTSFEEHERKVLGLSFRWAVFTK